MRQDVFPLQVGPDVEEEVGEVPLQGGMVGISVAFQIIKPELWAPVTVVGSLEPPAATMYLLSLTTFFVVVILEHLGARDHLLMGTFILRPF